MKRFEFIKLPVVLLLVFFVGKLIVGAAGGSYELGIRLFAMVPLTAMLSLIWGAMGRAYRGFGIGQAIQTGASIAIVAQVLIFGATVLSYLLGAHTHFNNPIAIVGEDRAVALGEAVMARGVGLVVNTIISCITASIGWALGKLLPTN